MLLETYLKRIFWYFYEESASILYADLTIGEDSVKSF